MTLDRITISGLRVPAHIGVTDAERERPQELVIDVELEVDLTAAEDSDDLADTIDYDRLTTDVATLVRESRVKLLETLAGRLASHARSFSGVQRVSVAVWKESPPVSEDVGPIAVRITRP